MRTLYLRIYLTVVVVLLAFALGAGWLAKSQLEHEREQVEAAQEERLHAMAALLQRALPPADADPLAQAQALRQWGHQLRLPLALESAKGERLGASPRFERLEDLGGVPPQVIPLSDGRRLLLMRPWRAQRAEAPLPLPPGLGVRGVHAMLALFVALFVGVALGAWPVVRRLTRRLEDLKQGVERFGAGDLQVRVAVEGRDELATLGQAFNQTAERVASLLRSHQSLVANASHELRSPLARLKMALALRAETPAEGQPRLEAELTRNLAELDALVEELLMSARLDAQSGRPPQWQQFDLLALAAEEAARQDVALEELPAGLRTEVRGDERQLRRALRNLIENARRYGGAEQSVRLARSGDRLELRVQDRGPGVPAELRERIFESFFRLPGHAEVAGGVGLGLALVRQIAQAHQGSVRCEPREGGGSVFVLSLPIP